MKYDYEYRASQALASKEFRYVKLIYSAIIAGVFAYGIKKISAGDHIMGIFFLVAALLNTLSPLTLFNFLGQKSPLDFYFLIQNGEIRFKLSTFSKAKTILIEDIERIGYAGQTIAIKYKNGKSEYIEANKIFGKPKQAELKEWINKFSCTE